MTEFWLDNLTPEQTEMLRNARDVNVLMGDGIEPGDVELFFGPLAGTEDVILRALNPVPWSKLLVICGFFGSRRDAKGAGWDRAVEAGFSMHTIGKLRRNIAVLHAWR